MVKSRSQLEKVGVVQQPKNWCSPQNIHRICRCGRAIRSGLHFQKISNLGGGNARSLQREINTQQHCRDGGRILAGFQHPDHRCISNVTRRHFEDYAVGPRFRRHIRNGRGLQRGAHHIGQLVRIGHVGHCERDKLPTRSGVHQHRGSREKAVRQHDAVPVRRLDRGVPQPDMLDPAGRVAAFYEVANPDVVLEFERDSTGNIAEHVLQRQADNSRRHRGRSQIFPSRSHRGCSRG